tara:strand:+ start:340 stop:522 length:183 start_codon:yes stop_codon:yes gene_type:complete
MFNLTGPQIQETIVFSALLFLKVAEAEADTQTELDKMEEVVVELLVAQTPQTQPQQQEQR